MAVPGQWEAGCRVIPPSAGHPALLPSGEARLLGLPSASGRMRKLKGLLLGECCQEPSA